MLLFAAAVFIAGSPQLRTEPTGSQGKAADKDAIIKQVKEIYICKKNSMYISESEKSGALCPDGAKVIGWAERMIKDGWEKEDILELVRSLKMGMTFMEKVGMKKTGKPVCATDGKLRVEAFIMSYCPFGVRYVTGTLVPMIDMLGDSVDYTPYFIMEKGPDGKLSAMHGQTEVDENLRMVCLREKWSKETWFNYTKCFAEHIYGNKQNPKEWKYCAEVAGVDAKKLDACFKNEAADLAEADLKLVAKYGAGASPTAIYNCDNKIVGAIPFDAAMAAAMCSLIPDPKPAVCKK